MKNYPRNLQVNEKPPLHDACFNHKFGLVKELIKNGIDIDFQDADGQTALYLTRNIEIIKILLAAGANPDLQEKYAGYTALMDTLIWPNRKKFLLLAEVSNTNIKTVFGYTALMLASRTNDIEAIELLIHAGADPFKLNNEGEDFYDLLPVAGQKIISTKYPAFINERKSTKISLFL